jgi:hypothetical protein
MKKPEEYADKIEAAALSDSHDTNTFEFDSYKNGTLKKA